MYILSTTACRQKKYPKFHCKVETKLPSKRRAFTFLEEAKVMSHKAQPIRQVKLILCRLDLFHVLKPSTPKCPMPFYLQIKNAIHPYISGNCT